MSSIPKQGMAMSRACQIMLENFRITLFHSKKIVVIPKDSINFLLFQLKISEIVMIVVPNKVGVYWNDQVKVSIPLTELLNIQ